MDNEALKVQMDNLQKILENVGETQKDQWKEINTQSNQIIGIKGNIEVINKTKELHQKALEKEMKEIKDATFSNTTFRQNMEGFSMIRHGIPAIAVLVSLFALIYSIWPK